METSLVALGGAAGTVAFFACISFAVWVDYRRKRDEGEAAHRERMKALELGHAPLEAEIERAKAYASAAWAAGLIGLLVPLAVVTLTVVGTVVAVMNRSAGQDITAPLIVAWSIAGMLVLVTVVASLGAIRRLPRPTAEASRQVPAPERSPVATPAGFQAKRSEMEI